MEKHTLYFQTEKSAEEAIERLCTLVNSTAPSPSPLGVWQSIEPVTQTEGKAIVIIRSIDPIESAIARRIEAVTHPCKSVWNEDAWVDTSYQHAFYYYRQDDAQDSQDFIHYDTAVLAWSRVVPVHDDRYKVLFGTKLPLTEREQRMWIATFDPDAFEFNEHVR